MTVTSDRHNDARYRVTGLGPLHNATTLFTLILFFRGIASAPLPAVLPIFEHDRLHEVHMRRSDYDAENMWAAWQLPGFHGQYPNTRY